MDVRNEENTQIVVKVVQQQLTHYSDDLKGSCISSIHSRCL